MAYPRRQAEAEPIKRISLNMPWTLYQQIADSQSVNARIIELIQKGLKAESK